MSSFQTSGRSSMKRRMRSAQGGIIHHRHFHTARPQQLFLAHEGAVLANHHTRNAIEQDRARTHGARAERRIQRAFTIDPRRLPSGIFQCVHFTVQRGGTFLDTAVVAAPDDPSLVNKNGTDGNAALVVSSPSFIEGSLQKVIHGRGLSGENLQALPRTQARFKLKRQKPGLALDHHFRL